MVRHQLMHQPGKCALAKTKSALRALLKIKTSIGATAKIKPSGDASQEKAWA
jgi:hypothetical protein